MKNYKSDDFKRKLLIVLNKPYNHNEYQMLLREAAERKPLCKMKNLRSITISYATEQSSNSYLDYYPGNELYRHYPGFAYFPLFMLCGTLSDKDCTLIILLA